MAKLTETQTIILSAGAQRPENIALPLPKGLAGAAAKMAVSKMIEHGSLRTFLGETQYVSLAFGATLAVAGYWLGQFIARMLAIWPIGRFIKRF